MSGLIKSCFLQFQVVALLLAASVGVSSAIPSISQVDAVAVTLGAQQGKAPELVELRVASFCSELNTMLNVRADVFFNDTLLFPQAKIVRVCSSLRLLRVRLIQPIACPQLGHICSPSVRITAAITAAPAGTDRLPIRTRGCLQGELVPVWLAFWRCIAPDALFSFLLACCS